MAKYKAKKGFADLDSKYFGVHKQKTLISGGSIEVTVPELVPDEVMKQLQEIKPKKKKGDK